jgi:hypothetical protein
MGLNMNQKQAVTREYLSKYQKAAKKENSSILDEFTPPPASGFSCDPRYYPASFSHNKGWSFAVRNSESSTRFSALSRHQMRYIAERPAFHITRNIAEKLKKTSPATIDRCLKKDKESLSLKGKSLTKPLNSLKSRIPASQYAPFTQAESGKRPGSGKSTPADFSPRTLIATQ